MVFSVFSVVHSDGIWELRTLELTYELSLSAVQYQFERDL